MRSNRHARANHRADCAKTRRLRAVRRLPAAGSGRPGVFSSANEEAEAALYQLGTVAAEPVVATWDQGLRMQVDCTFGRRGWSGGHDRGARRPRRGRASAHGERAPAPARRRHAALAASAPAPSCWLAPACSTAASSPRTGARPTGCASCTPRCGWRTASTWTAASTGPRPASRPASTWPWPDRARPRSRSLRPAGFMRRGGEYSQTLRLQDRAGAFRELVQKMEARLSARWSIDDMADACGMSRRTFQRKFIAHFGVAPTEVLRMLRRSAPAPCRRPARCRRKMEGTWGRWADRPAALACRRHGRPPPHRHPPHMDQLPGHEGGAPVHEHGHHVRHLFRQAAAAHRDRGLQRARARIAGDSTR